MAVWCCRGLGPLLDCCAANVRSSRRFPRSAVEFGRMSRTVAPTGRLWIVRFILSWRSNISGPHFWGWGSWITKQQRFLELLAVLGPTLPHGIEFWAPLPRPEGRVYPGCREQRVCVARGSGRGLGRWRGAGGAGLTLLWGLGHRTDTCASTGHVVSALKGSITCWASGQHKDWPKCRPIEPV